MQYSVPQYIDIEDKIAFQLTAKQLGWFALAGFFIFLSYNFLPHVMFYVALVVFILLALAFSFLKPFGVPFAVFVSFGFLHLVKPKFFIWQKGTIVPKATKYIKKEKRKNIRKERPKNLDEIIQIIDSSQKI